MRLVSTIVWLNTIILVNRELFRSSKVEYNTIRYNGGIIVFILFYKNLRRKYVSRKCVCVGGGIRRYM